MEIDESLLDVTEAADLCHLRVSTLRRWVGARRLPFVKLGRRVLFRRKDIKELIEQNLVPALSGLAVPIGKDNGTEQGYQSDSMVQMK